MKFRIKRPKKKIKIPKKPTLPEVIKAQGKDIFCSTCGEAIYYRGEKIRDAWLVSYYPVFVDDRFFDCEMMCDFCWRECEDED